jgi:hypothetical protein
MPKAAVVYSMGGGPHHSGLLSHPPREEKETISPEVCQVGRTDPLEIRAKSFSIWNP